MNEKTKALIDEVKAGVSKVQGSEDWKACMANSSKFWRYSFYNQLLIGSQCPDASRVAGFKTWKSLGRHVKKGERALRILAPRVITKEDHKGDEVKGIAGFFAVPVFDVSQTEGKELPTIFHPLKGTAPDGVFSRAEALMVSKGYTVSFEPLRDGLYGFVDSKKRIVLREGESQAQTLSTMVHEMSHALLGHVGDEHKARDAGELEAETASWIVCRNLGLETSDSSFTYLATWAQGDERDEKLEKAGSRACKVAKEILAGLESKN